MKLPLALVTLSLPMAALAAQPRMDDYSSGMTIEASPDRPIVEIVLPDAVYTNITRPDLADLRVFNRDGNAVPHAVCAPDVAIDPVWFIAETDPRSTSRSLLFTSSRVAPVSYARLRLAEANSSVRIAIESRNDEKVSWRRQWNGEFYSIMASGERRGSPPAEFPNTWDKYWRIEPVRATDPFYDTTILELGYRPTKLRFLAQGAGPFTLAYGSRRAEPAPAQSCDRLLADVNAKDLADLITTAVASMPRSLGGATALKALPPKTPVRLMVLWSVLIAGVGLLIAMAFALFRRLQQA